MKGGSIRISEKHGVNPSLIKCFFCGESKGIALSGKLKDDAQAPKEMLCDYDPCDKCAKEFEDKILIIEAQSTPLVDNQFPIQKDCYPTGRWVLAKEGIRKFFTDIPEDQKVFLIEPAVATYMGLFDD